MKKKNYKGRCTKRNLSKCQDICRTYDTIQTAYADILQEDETISSFECNVYLDGLSEGEYTSDFVCRRSDGSLLVCECVQRKHLTKPLTVKLLDLSRIYWLERNADWRIITDCEEK